MEWGEHAVGHADEYVDGFKDKHVLRMSKTTRLWTGVRTRMHGGESAGEPEDKYVNDPMGEHEVQYINKQEDECVGECVEE